MLKRKLDIREQARLAVSPQEDEFLNWYHNYNRYYTELPETDRNKTILALYNNFEDYILFEDDHLLIINKPTNISSHGNSKSKFGVEEVANYVRGNEVRLSHRLDSFTSGVLVLTKDWESHFEMSRQFADKDSAETIKMYTALLQGKFDRPDRIKVERAIQSINNKPKVRVHSLDSEEFQSGVAKYSCTYFEPIALYQSNVAAPSPVTLTAVQIETGRTHQIRAVSAHIGMPVVGDHVYGNKEHNTFGYMLHAIKLRIIHPATQDALTITAPTPRRFDQFIRDLRFMKRYNR